MPRPNVVLTNLNEFVYCRGVRHLEIPTASCITYLHRASLSAAFSARCRFARDSSLRRVRCRRRRQTTEGMRIDVELA
jgi:hypothetical protein